MSSAAVVRNALDQYSRNAVQTGIESASPHRLTQMLMEGALDKVATAKGCLERNDLAGKGRQISWAMSIISGLRTSLDMETGGPIAANLDDLYEYMTRRLIDASTQNDADALSEVGDLMLEIKGAWDAMPEEVRASGGAKHAADREAV